MNKTRWKGQPLMIDRAKPHFTARPDPSRPMPRKVAEEAPKEPEAPETEKVSSAEEEEAYDEDDHENSSSDSSEDEAPRSSRASRGPGENGVYLGPSRERSLTLSQWIWTEDADEKFVRRARKQGWKLQRISTRIKVGAFHLLLFQCCRNS